jgi:hypothetical protein
MAKEQAATLRAQWLGQQLREMREAAGLTLKAVGDYVNRNASTVSRMESGVVSARVPDVLAYLDICGIDDPRRRADLTTMARDAWQKGWWDGFTVDTASLLIDWIWLENRAVKVRCFQIGVVPGLLQTPEYAAALIHADQPDLAPAQVERFVELRLTRQQRLREDEPLAVSAVVDEAVLRRPVGGPAVMRAQLEHLRELTRHKHIEVRVLPASQGAHASPDGGFDILDMPRPYARVACISTAAGIVVIEGREVDGLIRKYDRLYRAALRPKESDAFLLSMIRHWGEQT